ncbi:hypothetical protein ACIQNG_15680 [Streptomyces sp. NPDC091377]|uniref:hypothetical protein n=1 Tax=Streptomyces sp. NPDC091377 TaxID=3365995 RepID=UPI0038300972
MSLLPLHASLVREESLTADRVTGEVRVPVALYEIDEHRGFVSLVCSRTEARTLFTQLAEALGLVHGIALRAGLEAVR